MKLYSSGLSRARNLLQSCMLAACLAYATGCTRPPEPIAPNGLPANRWYYTETLDNVGRVRLFSSGGEIFDTAVISHFLARREDVAAELAGPDAVKNFSFYSGSSAILNLDLCNFRAALAADTLYMQQVDTSLSRFQSGKTWKDYYQRLQEVVVGAGRRALDIRDSYWEIRDVGETEFHEYLRREVRAVYQNDVLIVPYTTIAGALFTCSYPFRLKEQFTLPLQDKDTILLRGAELHYRRLPTE